MFELSYESDVATMLEFVDTSVTSYFDMNAGRTFVESAESVQLLTEAAKTRFGAWLKRVAEALLRIIKSVFMSKSAVITSADVKKAVEIVKTVKNNKDKVAKSAFGLTNAYRTVAFAYVAQGSNKVDLIEAIISGKNLKSEVESIVNLVSEGGKDKDFISYVGKFNEGAVSKKILEKVIGSSDKKTFRNLVKKTDVSDAEFKESAVDESDIFADLFTELASNDGTIKASNGDHSNPSNDTDDTNNSFRNMKGKSGKAWKTIDAIIKELDSIIDEDKGYVDDVRSEDSVKYATLASERTKGKGIIKISVSTYSSDAIVPITGSTSSIKVEDVIAELEAVGKLADSFTIAIQKLNAEDIKNAVVTATAKDDSKEDAANDAADKATNIIEDANEAIENLAKALKGTANFFSGLKSRGGKKATGVEGKIE